MASTASPSAVDGLDGVTDADAHGTRVKTNTRSERVEGEYVHPRTLDAGDSVYVEYRERREMGGLSYTPNGMEVVARVEETSDREVVLRPDFAPDGEASIRLDGEAFGHSGHPTLVLNGSEYGVLHVIRRTDTDDGRERNAAAVRLMRGKGIEAKYDGGGGKPVSARLETPDDYRYVAALANEVGADVEFTWYETEDDLRGERGRKPKESVDDHDSVRATFDAS